jgi:hypothetical protein
MKRSSPWLFAIPLMLAGSQAAHVLAYRWEYPNPVVRSRVLAATGHGYLHYLPLVLGLGGAVLLVALLFAIRDVRRGVALRALPAWAFALVPPLGFSLQELSERALEGGVAGWSTMLEPTFLVGLLLQLPFAVAAYLVARLLIGTALRVAQALPTTSPSRRYRRAETPIRRWSEPALATAPLLARRMAERGPPAVAV